MRTLVLLAVAGPLCGQPKSLFYLTDRMESLRSFAAHALQIDIAGPQVYSADEKGLLWGGPDPEMLRVARAHKVGVMPLVVNPGFRQDSIHGLLVNADARRRLCAALLEECRRHTLLGIQFDFENIAYDDRDLYTALVKEAAGVLHPAGYQLSVAIVSRSGEFPGKGDFARWMYVNWRGAFDVAALARHADFISVMTYDQHTRYTPPGPVAGFPWVEQVMAHMQAQAPREKLSLGIPTYGRRWHAGVRERDPAVLMTGVSTAEALELAKSMEATPQWDPIERAPWYWFYRDGAREYVFFNDARSFRERYELARRDGLHGISVWVLGNEDPAIWDLLPPRANR